MKWALGGMKYSPVSIHNSWCSKTGFFLSSSSRFFLYDKLAAVSVKSRAPLSILRQANVDLSVDIAPFLGVAKCPNQFLKCFRMLRSVFEPSQKIKRLANISAMIELPCDRRYIPYSFGDVMRFILEDVSALFPRQIPPSCRFSNWDKGRPRRL